MAILPNLAQAQAELEALRAENARLKAMASAPRRLSMKVSEKGAVSLYGLGRWPVTLYRSQWQTLLANTKQIDQFLIDNADLLADKA